jgi:maleylacetoacetate isomerase
MAAPSRELILYAYWRSSASYRVRLALAAKKLPFRTVPVNIVTGENREEAHVARSPTSYVPSLVIDGVAYSESIALLELLDELYPDPPLYPRDPFARARVRALVEIVNAGIQPLQNLAVVRHLSEDEAVRGAWTKHWIVRGLGAFDRAVAANHAAGARGDYSYGSSLTAADLVLIPQLYAARRFQIDLGAFPHVKRAGETALAYPGLDAAAPEKQPDALPPG